MTQWPSMISMIIVKKVSTQEVIVNVPTQYSWLCLRNDKTCRMLAVFILYGSTCTYYIYCTCFLRCTRRPWIFHHQLGKHAHSCATPHQICNIVKHINVHMHSSAYTGKTCCQGINALLISAHYSMLPRPFIQHYTLFSHTLYTQIYPAGPHPPYKTTPCWATPSIKHNQRMSVYDFKVKHDYIQGRHYKCILF